MTINNTTNDAEQRSVLARAFERAREIPEFGVTCAFLTLVILFTALNPVFFTWKNLTGVFTIVSELGMETIGETFLIISGEFDLSVGSVYAFSGFVFARMAEFIPSPLSFVITLVIASGIGFLNSQITLRFGIPSFIATLGSMWFFRGIMIAVTGGATVTYKGDTIIPTLLSSPIGLVRPSHIWFIALAVAFSFLLTRTTYGNWVFATGGAREVARALGVPVTRVKTINFMLCSMTASIAGMVVLTRFNIANATFGLLTELEAIASTVIGGTYLFGGYGTILGCALGAILVGMIRIGLVMAGAPGYWYQTFVGAILVIAAIVNQKLRRAQV